MIENTVLRMIRIVRLVIHSRIDMQFSDQLVMLLSNFNKKFYYIIQIDSVVLD